MRKRKKKKDVIYPTAFVGLGGWPEMVRKVKERKKNC